MIRYFRVTILTILIFSDVSAQKGKTICCDVLLKPINLSVKIYNKPNGMVIYSIKNDSIAENYYNLSVIGTVKKGWLKVKPNSLHDTSKTEGWVQVENVGIYTNNYDRVLNLYKKPNKFSKISCQIQEYHPEIISVFIFKKCWLLVEIKVNGKIQRGWLSPLDQCANYYTTCN